MAEERSESKHEGHSKDGVYGGRPPPYGGGAYGGAYGGAHGEPYGGYGGYGGYGQYTAPYYGDPHAETGIFGEISLRRLHRLVMRKWVAILLVTGFGVAGAFFYLSKLTPMYLASCLLEMSVRRPRLMAQQSAVIEEGAWNPDEVFGTRLEKFRGQQLTEYALALLRDELGGREFTPEETEAIVRNLGFNLVRRTMLVRVNSMHADPRMAQVVANTFGKAAQQFAFDENKTTSDNAVKWLQTQTASQRKELEEADRRLTSFRATNNLDVMENELKTVQQTKLDLNSQLTSLRGQQVLADEVLKAIQSIEAQPENAGKLPDATPRKAEIVAAVDRWLAAVAERDLALSRYTAKHPDLKVKEDVIKVLRQQVSDAFVRAKETASSNLSLLLNQRATLEKELEGRTTAAMDLEKELVSRRAEYNSLERERDAADASYKGLLNRIEEARLSADENTATVKIVEPAGVPSRPAWPNRVRYLISGALLGLLLGFGFALLTDTLEDRVMGTEDLERTLGARVIGLVPHSRFVKREDLAKCALTQKFSQMTEAFAGIRGLLDSAQYRDQSRAILVTSTAPEEGKTIISTNLAGTMAQAGIRTLLIDFDMRRPRIAKIFAIPESHPSLIHELAKPGGWNFDALPYQVEGSSLFLISGRATREISPSEVVGSRSVAELLAWATQKFDRVVLDSPPYGIVSDAITLASYVQGILLVCRPSNTRKRSLRHAVRQFRDAGANVLGVLVNDIDFRAGSYFSNYDYYYGHYYSYKYRNYYGTRETKGGKKPGDKAKGAKAPPEPPPAAVAGTETPPPDADPRPPV